MSRDMKKSSRSSGRSGSSQPGNNSLLAGLMVGLFVGIGIAVAVAVYLNYSGNPFSKDKTPPSDALASAPETATAAPEVLQPGNGKDVIPAATVPAASKVASAGDERFDFYKMLPEASEKTHPAATGVPAASKPKSLASAASAVPAKPGILQVGAFQNENDADNLKAKLALIGIESRIQTSEVADKGIWHRVRVGPFSDAAELERTRNLLKANGIDSTIVR